jgi:hypothetical protein
MGPTRRESGNAKARFVVSILAAKAKDGARYTVPPPLFCTQIPCFHQLTTRVAL